MKPIKIVGLEAILAFIYDEDNPPSAVLVPGDDTSQPWCLHSLRSGPLSHNDLFFKRVAAASDVTYEAKNEDKYAAHAWKMYESFPKPGYICHGCNYLSDEVEDAPRHVIGKNSDEVCTKLCEELA